MRSVVVMIILNRLSKGRNLGGMDSHVFRPIITTLILSCEMSPIESWSPEKEKEPVVSLLKNPMSSGRNLGCHGSRPSLPMAHSSVTAEITANCIKFALPGPEHNLFESVGF